MPRATHRKHTPITTPKQRGFFGAELGRKMAGKKGKTKMSAVMLKKHLKEVKGLKLSPLAQAVKERHG